MGFFVLGDKGNGVVSIFMDTVVCDFSFFLKSTRFTEWDFYFYFYFFQMIVG